MLAGMPIGIGSVLLRVFNIVVTLHGAGIAAYQLLASIVIGFGLIIAGLFFLIRRLVFRYQPSSDDALGSGCGLAFLVLSAIILWWIYFIRAK